jgi:hypothetical protein
MDLYGLHTVPFGTRCLPSVVQVRGLENAANERVSHLHLTCIMIHFVGLRGASLPTVPTGISVTRYYNNVLLLNFSSVRGMTILLWKQVVHLEFRQAHVQ